MALKDIPELQVSDEKTHIRRRQRFVKEKAVMDEINRRTLHTAPLPFDATFEKVTDFFNAAGKVASVKIIRHPTFPSKTWQHWKDEDGPGTSKQLVELKDDKQTVDAKEEKPPTTDQEVAQQPEAQKEQKEARHWRFPSKPVDEKKYSNSAGEAFVEFETHEIAKRVRSLPLMLQLRPRLLAVANAWRNGSVKYNEHCRFACLDLQRIRGENARPRNMPQEG